MGRNRRDKSKTAHLEGELRHLIKVNKQLKKQLARADKAVIDIYNTTPESIIEFKEEEVTQSDRCPTCKSNISYIDFGSKVVISCKSCGYRKVEKKIEE